jgi:autophagy-related protein 5
VLSSTCRHWPIGLLFDHHAASRSNAIELPLRLTLHLHGAPADKLPHGNALEACRVGFMNMVKEADYVRWGNIRRVTALRKAEQDALWEGVVERAPRQSEAWRCAMGLTWMHRRL